MSSRIIKPSECEPLAAEPWRPPGGAAPVAGAAGASARSRNAPEEAQLQEAYQRGYRDGEAAGRSAVQPVIDKLAQTIESLASLRHRARREAEADLLKLSIAIARRIIHRELSVDPEAVAGLIRTALDKLAALEAHRVRVHPQMEPAVRHALEKLAPGRQIQVVADAGRAAGDVIFETRRGNLDASVETQLDEISRGLADRLRGR